MSLWTAVLLASAAAFATKYAGHVVPGHWLEGPRISRVMALMPVALLAALDAVQTVAGPGGRPVVDSRLAALVVAAVALRVRRHTSLSSSREPRRQPDCARSASPDRHTPRGGRRGTLACGGAHRRAPAASTAPQPPPQPHLAAASAAPQPPPPRRPSPPSHREMANGWYHDPRPAEFQPSAISR